MTIQPVDRDRQEITQDLLFRRPGTDDEKAVAAINHFRAARVATMDLGVDPDSKAGHLLLKTGTAPRASLLPPLDSEL